MSSAVPGRSDMGWGKLDDGYATHPKMIEAGADALALDVAGICYANRQLTDGFISDKVLTGLFPPLKQVRRVAQTLVKVGRWERDDYRKGYLIHDFVRYNFTSEEVKRKQAINHDRATRAAAARWDNARKDSQNGNASQHASEHPSEDAPSMAASTDAPTTPSRPVPSEVNLPLTPTPDGVGEPKRIPKNSRAHGTSPRQVAAKKAGQTLQQERLVQARAVGVLYADIGKTPDVAMDLIESSDHLRSPEERQAAVEGYHSARVEGSSRGEDRSAETSG